jgi:hypothetical protein
LSREAVRIAEAFADGNDAEVELRAAFNAVFLFVAGASECFADEAALNAAGDTDWFDFPKTAGQRAECAALHAAEAAAGVRLERVRAVPRGVRVPRVSFDAERDAQVTLLHCVFDNPFRSVVFAPTWRTDTALTLARQMYESRDFSAMPILADALQEAGCDNADILDHCRGPGPHVRGCWVVDLVLGKE